MTEQHERCDWVTVKEFATLRRVHIQTVYTAIRGGELQKLYPVERVGRSIRVGVPRGTISERRAS